MMLVSIIIRTKNEERWIKECLRRILHQTYKKYEIIIVDNKSNDKTLDKAKEIISDIKIISINDYKPGKALNYGIKNSNGEIIVCLSAHCLPVKNDWLINLIKDFTDSNVAGIYGRQIPMGISSDYDKRDLLLTFGKDKRIQIKDSFFHNANAAIKKDIWEKYPFDEEVTNIEDRIWGEKVTKNGYKIIYTPDAVVYHYHGIHQNNNKYRCKNVVKILENMEIYKKSYNVVDIKKMEIATIIPIKIATTQNLQFIAKLLNILKNQLDQSNYIKHKFVSTDSSEIAKIAENLGFSIPFIRPKKLSAKNIRVDNVLSYTLKKLENEKICLPDLVLPLEITFPFRPNDIFDKMIEKLLQEGLDTIIAGKTIFSPVWIKKFNNEYKRIDDYRQIRKNREAIHMGLSSLCCVTYPDVIRKGTRYGKKIGIYELESYLANTEIYTENDLNLLLNEIKNYQQKGLL